MFDIIQRINCIETPAGYVLTWDIASHENVVRTTVYGLNGAREFVLDSPLTGTGRFVLYPDNYAMASAFKLSVVTVDGRVDVSKPISPQKLVKTSRLLLEDMRRRARIYMDSTPIGSYDCKLLLRRIDGAACTLCGSAICSGRGGDPITDHCPECLGTGISEPYYTYPCTVKFHGVSPRDDKNVSQNPDVQRSHIVRVFQTAFDLPLRDGDIIVSGTEAYRVMSQDIPASVSNVPVYYNLTVIKIAPEDPRYPTYMDLAYGGCAL